MSNYLDPYAASLKPELVTVEPTQYLRINKEIVAESKEAMNTAITLDILSQAIHTELSKIVNYEVFPLEGVWHFLDEKIGVTQSENIHGFMMMKQPHELNEKLLQTLISKLQKKHHDLIDYFDETELVSTPKEQVVQLLHIGAYHDEGKSFTIINQFLDKNKLTRKDKSHREIYLKDMRHVEKPAQFETILRVTV